MRTLLLSSLIILIPGIAHASPVINEVMWMGSDLSTSDEWVEILNPSGDVADLSGWSLTTLNSSAQDAVITTFPSGTVLDAGESIIIANAKASSSRLLDEPAFTTTAMSLPNTKLLLKLKDPSGTVIDSADDGVGNPFAGANPSGGVKASMERIDASRPGSDSGNWSTATEQFGFDQGSKTLGTPGYTNSVSPVSSSYSSSSAFSSSLSSFASSSSSVSSISSFSSSSSSSSASSDSSLPSEALPTGQAGLAKEGASSESSCTDPLSVQLIVQDGELTGVGHTTLNFQAVAVTGSIQTAVCHWSFSDGYTSESCNPPPHAFDTVGSFIVNLGAVNQCGNTLIQSLAVQVLPEPGASSSSSSSSVAFDGSRLLLSAALPNPKGSDTGKEWIEVRNPGDTAIDLVGWKLGVGTDSIRKYTLKGIVPASGKIRIFDSESTFHLSNADSTLRLYDPSGAEQSSIVWEKSQEDRIYYPDDLRKLDSVIGEASYVIDGDTFVFQPYGEAKTILGDDEVRVRLLGIDAPEVGGEFSDDSYSSLEYLRVLIEKKKVELEFDTTMWDEYGRLLAYVYTEDSQFAEKQMLSMGLASVTDGFPLRLKDELLSAESVAKSRKIGLWKNPKYTASLTSYGAQEDNENTVFNKSIIAQKITGSSVTKNSKVQSPTAAKKIKAPTAAQKRTATYAALYRTDIADAESNEPLIDPMDSPTSEDGISFTTVFLVAIASSILSIGLLCMALYVLHFRRLPATPKL